MEAHIEGNHNCRAQRPAIFATAASPDDITYLTPNDAKRVGMEVTVVNPQPEEWMRRREFIAGLSTTQV